VLLPTDRRIAWVPFDVAEWAWHHALVTPWQLDRYLEVQ
jgi:hypothetical protein